ncbi:hypothetical protein HYU22_03875 [Candidatus Woesearchaeota archaeon]|nr:hypothetical protein [Candidatus Woesearchaeota archaeon]
MDVCIKNIPEEDWRIFKAESIKHGLKMGEFFNKVVLEHEASCHAGNWERILRGEKTCKGILSKEEGRNIRSEFRKDFSLRNH